MKTKDTSKASYLVGYAKPPKSSRFAKGTSGNPTGKKQGMKNVKTLVEAEGAQQIAVTEGGTTKVISKLEAVIKSMFQSALKGNVSATKEVLAALTSGDSSATAGTDYEISDADLNALRNHADFLKLIEQAEKAVDDGAGG